MAIAIDDNGEEVRVQIWNTVHLQLLVWCTGMALVLALVLSLISGAGAGGLWVNAQVHTCCCC